MLDTIMELSGTIGLHKKTMTFDTHVCLMFELKTFIQQVNIGTIPIFLVSESLHTHPHKER